MAVLFDAVLRAVRRETDRITSYELEPASGGMLPAFTAGAHIDLEIAPNVIRQYSLLGDPADIGFYRIAVLHEPGGASEVLRGLKPRDTVRISVPRNHFPLHEDGAHTVLIAAGIGITALWSMAQRLARLGRPWELHYGARSRAQAALLSELQAFACGTAGRMHFYFSDEGARLPLPAIVAAAPLSAQLYACGPRGLLNEFEQLPIAATQARHVERFAPAHKAAHDGGFTVVLAKSGRRVAVPKGATILEALKAHRIAASYSCTEGICGQCETKVLGGTPDHRDSILTEAERAAGKTMMICCSGSHSAELVLDL